MTNSPPPDPQSSSRTPLGFDEFVGIFVALSTIGAILFWSLSQKNGGLEVTGVLLPSADPTTQPTLIPSPGATPAPVPPLFPAITPTEPEAIAPVPPQERFRQRVPSIIPLPTTQAPAAPTPINFVDVPEDFWARPFITALAARGIVNGFPGGYFRPNYPVTRAEFAALLQEAFAQSPGSRQVLYKDISPDFWAVPAINRATETGFLQGYPDNTFRPTQEISKAQVLVALTSGLNLTPPSAPNQVLQQVYRDAGQIPNYATAPIAAATEAGIVVNYPELNLLNPNVNATRAEVAAMIYQALVQAGRLEPIQSQYVVRQPNQ